MWKEIIPLNTFLGTTSRFHGNGQVWGLTFVFTCIYNVYMDAATSIRLPEALLAKIDASAKRNKRSRNSEILMALEDYFDYSEEKDGDIQPENKPEK